jgi:hypothetical protein
MPNETQNLPAVSYYTPVELVGIYRSFLERGKSNGVVWLRGIYIQKPNQNPGWAAFYDELRDVNTNVTVTLKINRQDRSRLQSNSLVQVGGIIELTPFSNGTIQIVVNVTRFEIVKDQFITEEELKLFDLRKKKLAIGQKNVKALLSQVIMEGKRKPKVALILAQSSITQGDFEDGLRAARATFEFDESRVTFTQTDVLCNTLRRLDSMGYDAIAIYRGGGIDSSKDVDKPAVIETVVSLSTPFISGVGHRPEKIFLREVADYWTSNPQGLGQYFSEIHENASAMRNNSRAALIEDIKKQFIKQIEDANKKNKELLEQVGKLNKQAEEQRKANTENLKKLQEENAKAHQKQLEENKKNLEAQQKKNDDALAKVQAQAKEQMDKSNKQNEELQKKITELTKTNSEQMGKLQGQLKKQTEENAKQAKDFKESLTKMQTTNGELNKSLQKLTAQNTQAAKDLNDAKDRQRQLERQLEEALKKKRGCLGMVTTVVTLIGLASWIVCILI